MTNRQRHLKTVRAHRKYVCKMCFKMGLIWQGLTHDLSKYSIKEMSVAKFANGKQSPHEVARQVYGYSSSWNHHYHHNKHHWQYWVDEMENATSAKMPYNYVVEAFCDMVGASKAYRKEAFKQSDPYDYYKNKSPGLQRYMHKGSQALLVTLFKKYANMTEADFFAWYKQNKKTLKDHYISNELEKFQVE